MRSPLVGHSLGMQSGRIEDRPETHHAPGGSASGPLVVVGAHGGVGASSLAGLLALTARPGTTALVDLAGGGGLDVLLGIEGNAGVRWPGLADVHGDIDSDDLLAALPHWRGVPVLSSSRGGQEPSPRAVRAAFDALSKRHRMIIDLAPEHLGDAVGQAALEAARDVLVVASQDVIGVAALLRVRAREPRADRLVLRRRRSRTAPLEAAHVADVPLVGLLPHDRRLSDAIERGLGPVAGRQLHRAVRAVWRGTSGPS